VADSEMKEIAMKNRSTVIHRGSGRRRGRGPRPLVDQMLLQDLEIPDQPLLRKEDELRLGSLIQGALRRLQSLLLAHPGGRASVLARLPRGTKNHPSPEALCGAAREVLASELGSGGAIAVRRLNRVLGKVLRKLERDRDSLILSNVKLVLKEALRWRGKGIGISDLFQQGVMGLQSAVFRYDPRRGVRFSTYATYWIRQSIRSWMMNCSAFIRVPQRMRKEARSLHSRLPPAELERVRAILHPPLAFSNAENENGELQLPSRVRPGAGQPRDPALHINRIPEGVRKALRSLPNRERFILERKFGIGGKPETLEEIGQRLNLSRERIRQLKVEALGKLRGSSRLEDLCDELDHARAAELN
jgi:RNA polymerase primary sigma factor